MNEFNPRKRNNIFLLLPRDILRLLRRDYLTKNDRVMLLIALGTPRKKNRYFCHDAAKEGHLDLLKWAVTSGYPLVDIITGATYTDNPELYDWCWAHADDPYIKHSDLDILLKQSNITLISYLLKKYSGDTSHPISRSMLLKTLVKLGHTQLIQEYKYMFVLGDRLQNVYYLYYAALTGNLSLLRDLYHYGTDSQKGLSFLWAIRGGSIDCVKFLQGQNCPAIGYSLFIAAARGHIEIFKLLVKEGYNLDLYYDNVLPELLFHRKLAWEHPKYLLSEQICDVAAYRGHLDILKYAVANGIISPRICDFAAAGGHMHILEWAFANNLPRDRYTCAYAARYGHLEILQWLRANNCPWDNLTRREAAAFNHKAVLRWVKKNKCPTNSKPKRIFRVPRDRVILYDVHGLMTVNLPKEMGLFSLQRE